jgi:hypothetical protein
VTFGIETSTGANATINLYTIPSAAPLTLANLSPIGTSGAVPLPNTTLSSFTINVAGTVADPTTTDLYVEIFVPDFNQAFNFFPGSNPNGQIAPTFLRSAGCGAVEPTPTGDIGFPNMHLVMLVDGIEAAIPVTLQSVTVE